MVTPFNVWTIPLIVHKYHVTWKDETQLLNLQQIVRAERFQK